MLCYDIHRNSSSKLLQPGTTQIVGILMCIYACSFAVTEIAENTTSRFYVTSSMPLINSCSDSNKSGIVFHPILRTSTGHQKSRFSQIKKKLRRRNPHNKSIQHVNLLTTAWLHYFLTCMLRVFKDS